MPIFKQLVKSINQRPRNWKSILKIGVVNCNNAQERSICRQQAVGAYPTIKFYRPMLSPNFDSPKNPIRGIKYEDSRKLNILVTYILKFLTETSRITSKKDPGWRRKWDYLSGQPAPVLDPRQSSLLADLMIQNDYKRRSTKYVVVLYNTKIEYNQLVVLNLSSYRGVVVFYKVFDDMSGNSTTVVPDQPYAMVYPYCDQPFKLDFVSSRTLSNWGLAEKVFWDPNFLTFGLKNTKRYENFRLTKLTSAPIISSLWMESIRDSTCWTTTSRPFSTHPSPQNPASNMQPGFESVTY